MKRILAIIGVVLLLGMYAATFIFALMNSPTSANLFMASLIATIIVPVLIYGYSLVYKYLKNRRQISLQEDSSDPQKDD